MLQSGISTAMLAMKYCQSLEHKGDEAVMIGGRNKTKGELERDAGDRDNLRAMEKEATGNTRRVFQCRLMVFRKRLLLLDASVMVR